MQESFLHYIWQYQLFNQNELITSSGKSISIEKIGFPNNHDGPDFEMVKIKLDGIFHIGQIEIHLKSSDWILHKHQFNSKYNNVILHVVFEEDTDITINDQPADTLILKGRIPNYLLDNYEKLTQSKSWVPCADLINTSHQDIFKLWSTSLSIERYTRKSIEIKQLYESTGKSLERTFMSTIASCLGLSKNKETFSRLFQRIPYTVFKKIGNDTFLIEALLFATAGLLPTNPKTDYEKDLIREGNFLLHKYSLTPISITEWVFGGVRPANFPTVRIAQLAQLFATPHLYNLLSTTEDYTSFEKALNITPSDYWKKHYSFERENAQNRTKKIGKERRLIISVNGIIPFLFFLWQHYDDEKYQATALSILETLPPETNSILRKWEKLGLKSTSSMEAQALLELKKEYCTQSKCLKCRIGNSILKSI